jgi:transcriptional regulator with XRE-family HTH domain
MAIGILKNWLENDVESGRLFAEESLITEVLDLIHQRMIEADVSKSELANRLGTSKANISTILNGSRNITLRTVSNICFALNISPRFEFEEKSQLDRYLGESDYFEMDCVRFVPALKKRGKKFPMPFRAPENGEWAAVEELGKVA